MSSVVFTCESTHESHVVRNAVNAYRHILRSVGIDPRNYAEANSESAGFGWDAVQRTASDMHDGSVSYVSERMAIAIRVALRAKESKGGEDAELAGKLAHRMASAMRDAS